MDEVSDGKLNPQPQEPEGINKQEGVIKYPFAGRPRVEESPALQDEYINIYIDYSVGDLTEVQIASKRSISTAKVKKAVQWCRRQSNTCSQEEGLIDYINACNFRTQPLVEEEEWVREEIKSECEKLEAWQDASEEERRALPKPDIKRVVRLVKLRLDYNRLIGEWLNTKVKCLLKLDNIRSKEQGYVPPQIDATTSTEPTTMTKEDRKAISDIFERAEQRKALENR